MDLYNEAGEGSMSEDSKAMMNRFIALCKEVDADAETLIKEPPAILGSMIREWFTGQMNDVEMMRCLRNVAILNPKYAILHQEETTP
jgi:hypothetical protein